MARITKRMPTPTGVGKGETALAKLPIGNRFHRLFLIYSGVTLAEMTEIRVFANAKTIHRYSATERDVLNQYRGLDAAAGILEIPFDRQDLLTRKGQEETAINTGSQNPDSGQIITALNLEVDVDENAVGTPSFQVYAEISDRIDGGPGTVLHVKKHTRSSAGAGELEIADLPFNQRTAMGLNAVFMKPSANDISKIVVERGLYKVFERTKALNERIQTNGYRYPQAGWHAVDFTENRFGGNTLNLVGYQDFRYLLDMTGAAQLNIISEYMGQLGD